MYPQILTGRSTDDLHTNQDEKRYKHTADKVQLKPGLVHQDSSKTKPPEGKRKPIVIGMTLNMAKESQKFPRQSARRNFTRF